jgi:hypothetical protein
MPTEKETTECWMERIQTIHKERKERERRWRENIAFDDDERKHWGALSAHGRDSTADIDISDFHDIGFNLVRSNNKRIIPSIYFRDPQVFVTPRREGDVDNASIAQKLLNYTIRQIGFKAQAKRCIKDALLTGMGIMKIGYDSEYFINQKSKKEDRKTLENINVQPGSIWNLRVSPFDFLIDAKATLLDLSDAEFVVHKYIKPLEDVKAEKFYKNTGNLLATGRFPPRESYEDPRQAEKMLYEDQVDRREIVQLFEIWDRRNMEFIVMAMDHEKPLHKGEWPWELEGFPFEVLTFDHTPDQLYPSTDVDNYINMQKSINLFLAIIMDHAERALPRIFTKGVKEGDLAKLKSGLVDSVVDIGMNGTVIPWNPPNLNPDIYNILSVLREFVTIQSGITEFQRGVVPKGARTATAASLISQGTQTRMSEMIDVEQDWMSNIFRKDLELMQQEYTIGRVIPIVGNEPNAVEFLNVTKEQLKGEFDIVIEPFSATPRNKEMDRQQEIQYANLMMGAFQQIIDPTVLAKDLAKAFDKKNLTELLPVLKQRMQAGPPKDPAVENLILASGSQVSPTINEDQAAHIAVHTAGADSLAAQGGSEEVMFRFKEHIDAHNMLAQSQAQPAPGQGRPGPTGAMGPNLGAIPGLSPNPMQGMTPQTQTFADQPMQLEEGF